MVVLFRDASLLLGLHGVCLYQLRHGGASEDVLGQKRTIQAVQARGRWRTDSSLRRYAKPAQLQRLLASMPAAKVSFARGSLARLRELLHGEASPRRPRG